MLTVRFLTVGIVILGLVYRATDAKEGFYPRPQYAIKLERASKKRQRPSEHETNVLHSLADVAVSPRTPRVIDYGYDKPRHLVLDLLGADLQSLRKKYGDRF